MRCGYYWLDRSCWTRLHHAVVAALDAGMILVARHQQKRMHVSVRQHPVAGYLAAVIDVQGEHQRHIGIHQRVQIDGGTAVLPEKAVCGDTAADGSAQADDLNSGIDRNGSAAWIGTNGAQVPRRAIPPQHRMVHATWIGAAGRIANLSITDHVSGIVDPQSPGVVASQCAEVLQPRMSTLVPLESMDDGIPWQVRPAHDLASVVDCLRCSARAAE